MALADENWKRLSSSLLCENFTYQSLLLTASRMISLVSPARIAAANARYGSVDWRDGCKRCGRDTSEHSYFYIRAENYEFLLNTKGPLPICSAIRDNELAATGPAGA